MNEEFFVKVISTESTTLRKIAYAYLKDAWLAEDAVQEALLSAFTHWDKFKGDCNVRTWLIRIVINQCKTMRNKANYRETWAMIPIDNCPDVGKEDKYEDGYLRQMVRSLPYDIRTTIVLYDYHDMKGSTIARIMWVSDQCVRCRLFRGRNMLRKYIGGYIS